MCVQLPGASLLRLRSGHALLKLEYSARVLSVAILTPPNAAGIARLVLLPAFFPTVRTLSPQELVSPLANQLTVNNVSYLRHVTPIMFRSRLYDAGLAPLHASYNKDDIAGWVRRRVPGTATSAPHHSRDIQTK
jgi:hypothetical protein